ATTTIRALSTNELPSGLRIRTPSAFPRDVTIFDTLADVMIRAPARHASGSALRWTPFLALRGHPTAHWQLPTHPGAFRSSGLASQLSFFAPASASIPLRPNTSTG